MAKRNEPGGLSASVTARLAPVAPVGSAVRIAQWFAQAMGLHQQGRLGEAEPVYRQILALDPNHAPSLHLLGLLAHQVGSNEAAVDLIGKAISIDHRLPGPHSDIAAALKALGRLEEAAASLRRAISLQPGYAMAHCNLGILLKDLSRREEAVAAYRRAIDLQPDYAEAYYNLGDVLRDLDRHEESVSACRRATELKPDFAWAHFSLGIGLKALNRLDESASAFRRAIELKPDLAWAHCNLGIVFKDLGRPNEAVAACRRAIDLQPDLAEAHYNLGVALQFLGRFDESVSACRRAIELNADYAKAYNNLGFGLLNLNRLDEAGAAFARAVELEPDFTEADSNRLMCLNYRPGVSGTALLPEHRAWDRRHAGAFKQSAHVNVRDPERRLRIGYVSGDLCRHSVAYSLIDVLTSHDRSRFELFCYATGARVDDMTERLRAASDYWRSLAGVSDDDAAAMIRQDEIDILIDLAGHTAHGRLLLFARKPAPVQVNWMGYPNTTGLTAMDYRLVDPITDPPGIADGWASEALVRLQGGFLCYAPPPEAPQIAPPPSLASGTITFGSFNNPPKLSDPTIETWAQVLRRVPGARLLLKGIPFGEAAARARMQARFSTQGIGPERLILMAWMAATGSHLEAYGQIDIGLDPFPYNGTTTTCEALWMGVPVVSLMGERHVARVGASLLTSVGLQDLIAKDQEQYIEIAAALAQDTARLTTLRQTLRSRVKGCPLGDGGRFTPTLEAALRQMWRRWCAGEPATTFDVPASAASRGMGAGR